MFLHFSELSIFKAVTLKPLSDKLLVSVLLVSPHPRFLSYSFIWYIFLSFLILADFLYFFLLIRQNSYLFWFESCALL